MNRWAIAWAGIVCALGAASTRADIQVDIYRGHGTTGGGAPYSDLAGSFTTDEIRFATDTGYAWHPFGLVDFGADMAGSLDVAAAGNYKFTLNSDDGSLLFIDGLLAVDNGGAHSPRSVSNTVPLTGGTHPFELQFYEDFLGESGVDLRLPTGVVFTGMVEPPEPPTPPEPPLPPVPGSPAVPLPGAAVLAALGMTAAGWFGRRKNWK